ncbi:HAMP domain-containing protein [Caloranaerobacter azorensis DSM 13643]|uniref:histidine kinase n=1 Tax=Caloranaerobacter azorensis DSM 13643 TaxID=1121264 RepID=A0A1M5UFH0_9FIRM|nr:HAMP domain-containing sensor histidine kinase [Caloranaerobacter azorensis]SHH61648.1 HAMP domain-containing protein [Caloranaerobacter azorensis DSM 13643]
MRRSLKTKLFLSILLLTSIILGLVWFFNVKYLGSYYIERKKDNLVSYSNHIKNIYKGDTRKIYDELERIENLIGGNITIVASNGEIEYPISYRPQYGRMGRGFIPISKEDLKEILSGGTVIKIFKHPKFDIRILSVVTPLSSDKILIIQSSVASIEEGIDIIKDYYIYIAIISLIIGIILTFILTKIITEPILRLNKVARKMANLDFSHKYNVVSTDEIGQLGESLNYLSEKLSFTIDELNKANKKLREDIEKERRLDKMRKEFISNVSHELKTPIALIKGYAEGLKDNVIDDIESKNFYCEVIMDEAEKMSKLVKDLLDLSQLESGHYSLNKEKFNICNLVDKVLNKYSPIFKEKNINVSIKKDDDKMYVNGDRVRLEQVLVNLINNALNHIGAERVLEVAIRRLSNNAIISIYNSGNFIPEDEIDRIWESFYKVDKSRARKYGGTGLGLSIVKNILKLHNSNYGVRNVKNGVEFWFELELISIDNKNY